MTHAILVDFNQRDGHDNLIASRRRISDLPVVGEIVGLADDENNRALARVLRIDDVSVVLEPIWQTFANASQARIVPESTAPYVVVSFSGTTSVSIARPTSADRWRVEVPTGQGTRLAAV